MGRKTPDRVYAVFENGLAIEFKSKGVMLRPRYCVMVTFPDQSFRYAFTCSVTEAWGRARNLVSKEVYTPPVPPKARPINASLRFELDEFKALHDLGTDADVTQKRKELVQTLWDASAIEIVETYIEEKLA